MSYDLNQISEGVCMRAPRVIVLGTEKIGKSEFAAGSENPVFLPIKGEEGIDEIKVKKTPVCETLQDVLGWLRAYREQDHDRQTLVIDSASTLDPLVQEYVRAAHDAKTIDDVGGGYGKGHSQSAEEWRKVTGWLDVLRNERNMASIIIGHVEVRRFDDPNGDSYDQYMFDVHRKVSNLLFRWADCILFCNTKVVVKQEQLGYHKDNVKKRGVDIAPGSRFLFTQKRPAHPGGGRGVYGRLPYELPLGWDYFRDAVAKAMEGGNTK
jgi:hypothetical protein